MNSSSTLIARNAGVSTLLNRGKKTIPVSLLINNNRNNISITQFYLNQASNKLFCSSIVKKDYYSSCIIRNQNNLIKSNQLLGSHYVNFILKRYRMGAAYSKFGHGPPPPTPKFRVFVAFFTISMMIALVFIDVNK